MFFNYIRAQNGQRASHICIYIHTNRNKFCAKVSCVSFSLAKAIVCISIYMYVCTRNPHARCVSPAKNNENVLCEPNRVRKETIIIIIIINFRTSAHRQMWKHNNDDADIVFVRSIWIERAFERTTNDREERLSKETRRRVGLSECVCTFAEVENRFFLYRGKEAAAAAAATTFNQYIIAINLI